MTSAHRLDEFECAESVLDDWLRRRALSNQLSGASRTFVVTDQDNCVCGYYAMAAGAVAHQMATSAVRQLRIAPGDYSDCFRALKYGFGVAEFQLEGHFAADHEL